MARPIRLELLKSESGLKSQRVAFYVALFDFAVLDLWIGVRIYYVLIGDAKSDRAFTFATIGILPLLILGWIISLVVVGNNILKYQRVTWYGIGALAMLAVPAAPVAAFTLVSWWSFFNSL